VNKIKKSLIFSELLS